MRGTKGNLIVLDECAYIEEKTLQSIIVPVALEDKSAIVMLSTFHEDPNNGFNRMVEQGAFPYIKISYVCDACLSKGIKTICKHMIDQVPPWMKKDMKMISTLDCGVSQGTFLRESMGIIEKQDWTVFDKDMITRLLYVPRYIYTNHSPLKIWVAIDPCVGSENTKKRISDFAIVSITTPDVTIVGMDAFEVNKPEDYKDKLIKHIQDLKSQFAFASFIFDIEAGTGLESSHIQNLITREIKTHSIFLTDFKNKHGTNTTYATKYDMMVLTMSAMNKNLIQISNSLVTVTPNVIETFCEQMINYEKKVVPGKTETSKNKIIFSGKKNGAKDDLCVTFQRAIRSQNKDPFQQ